MTIGVLPPDHRHGLGTTLLMLTLRLLRLHTARIELDVIVTNTAAINFYLKRGFVVRERQEGYYHFDGKRYDSFRMVFTGPQKIMRRDDSKYEEWSHTSIRIPAPTPAASASASTPTHTIIPSSLSSAWGLKSIWDTVKNASLPTPSATHTRFGSASSLSSSSTPSVCQHTSSNGKDRGYDVMEIL